MVGGSSTGDLMEVDGLRRFERFWQKDQGGLKNLRGGRNSQCRFEGAWKMPFALEGFTTETYRRLMGFWGLRDSVRGFEDVARILEDGRQITSRDSEEIRKQVGLDRILGRLILFWSLSGPDRDFGEVGRMAGVGWISNRDSGEVGIFWGVG